MIWKENTIIAFCMRFHKEGTGGASYKSSEFGDGDLVMCSGLEYFYDIDSFVLEQDVVEIVECRFIEFQYIHKDLCPLTTPESIRDAAGIFNTLRQEDLAILFKMCKDKIENQPYSRSDDTNFVMIPTVCKVTTYGGDEPDFEVELLGELSMDNLKIKEDGIIHGVEK